MPKYIYMIGPERDGHISADGRKLVAGEPHESDLALTGVGFNLVKSDFQSVTSAPIFSAATDTAPEKSSKKDKTQRVEE